MFFSISMLTLRFLLFVHFVIHLCSAPGTIDASCSSTGSDCGVGQKCIDGKCQCNPDEKKFYTDEKRGCVVCPAGFVRLPKRCFNYSSTMKTRNDAQSDCRRNQADLFSWKDNVDQNELITEATNRWKLFSTAIRYSWAGGIVHNSGGSTRDFKITWFDPRGPDLFLPSPGKTSSPYCDPTEVPGYNFDAEPTRLTRNGEKEDCISIVFVSDPNLGRICLADDFCSAKMGYLCEITPASLAGGNPLPTPKVDTSTRTTTTTTSSSDELLTSKLPGTDLSESTEVTDSVSALGGGHDSTSSNTLYFAIAGIVLVAIGGSIALIVIRKRKQKNRSGNMSPTASVANSTLSGDDMYA